MFVPIFMAADPLHCVTDHSVRSSQTALPPPTLQRCFSVTSQVYRVSWRVNAVVLNSDELETSSPPFPLSFSRDLRFQLVLQPRRSGELDGKSTFRTAEGMGRVLLRCLDEVDSSVNPIVTFRFVAGTARGEPPR